MRFKFSPARRAVTHSPWRRWHYRSLDNGKNPPPESTIRVLLPGRRYASPAPGGACGSSGPVDKPDNTRCPTPVVAGQHQLSRVGRAAVTQRPRQGSTTTRLSLDSPRPPPSPTTHCHAPRAPRSRKKMAPRIQDITPGSSRFQPRPVHSPSPRGPRLSPQHSLWLPVRPSESGYSCCCILPAAAMRAAMATLGGRAVARLGCHCAILSS